MGVITVLIACTLAVGACSHSTDSTPAAGESPSSQSAEGGETSCKDFIAAAKSRRDTIIENYLRATGQSTSSASVTTTRLSAEAFCRTSGKNKLVRDIATG